MRDHTDILNRAVEGVEPERAATVEEFQRGQLSFRDKFLASIYNPAQAQTAAFAEMIAAPVEAVGQVGTMLGASEDNLLRRGAEGFRSLFDYDERMVVGGRPVVDPGLGSEFASGLGSAAGFIGGGAAAKLIGAGSKLTSAGLGAVTQAQSMYREAEAAGATDAQKFGAFALGGAVGTSEAIGIGSLLARLDKRSGGTLGSQLQRVVKFSGREAAEEAGQEAFQQFSQDIIAQQILKYAEPEDVEQLIANAAKGGLIGGMVGGFLGGAGVLGQDAAIEGAIKQEATEGARGVLGTIQQAEKEEVKERKTPEQAVEVLKRKNKVEDASWEIVTEESADEEQADFLATVTQMREAGGSLPDIVLVDGGQELPNQGVYTGGVIVIDAQRAADAKSAILLHEMVHHSMPVGSEAFKAAAAQAQQQFPLLAARMASIYDAMYTRQNGSRAYATVQDEAMRAALLFEEAMALGAEMMPKAVGEILSKPDALSDEALLADRTTLQAIRDWIVAAANKILRTSKFKGTRAKRLEESLAALEAERVLDIADGDADAVKAMLEALRGVYTQASPKEWGSAAESEVPGVPIQFQLPAAPETPLLEDPQAARRRRRPQEAEESRRRLRGEDVDPGQPAGRVETPGDAAAQESAIPLPEREGQVEVAGRRRPGRRVGERRAEGEPEAAPTPGVTAASEEQVAAEVSTAATEAGEPVAEAPESQQVEAAPEGLSAEEREVYDYLVSEGMAPDEALAELRDMVEEDASFDKSEFGERDKQRRKDGVEPDRFSVASGGMFDPRAAERDQTYTSERTSLKQIPASFKVVDWKPGTVNFDIGGGAFDLGTEYLSERGVTNLIYDPFNRSRLFNMKNVARAKGGVDTVTVANVLNVIAERGMRNRVLREAAAFLKPGGEVYIQVYEGDGKGESRVTAKGWQEHRKLDTYISEVEEVFGEVERKDKVLIAKSPLEAQDAGEAALLMQAEQAVGMKRHPEYGVGKLIGGDLYVEKSHMDRLPQKVQRIARRLAEQMPDYDYKVVKWNEREGTVSFIQSPDFDTAQEPLVTASVKHTPGKGFGKQTKHSNVYHHKWLFVAPDYAGFDVGESYQRTLDVVDMIERGDKKPSQLGTKKAWDEFTGGASRFSVAAPLDSPEFRRWFGNSKVVDAQGRPLVVYHGTDEEFTGFDSSRGGTVTVLLSTFDVDREGFYFSPEREAAETFGGIVMPVYLSIQNPLDIGATPDWLGQFTPFADALVEKGWDEDWLYNSEAWELFDGELGRRFVEEMKLFGYDGALIEEPGVEGVRELGVAWVAFRPEQIKSATGNVGAYGQRPVTEAEAAPLGMTAAEANEAQARGDVRFSVADRTPELELAAQGIASGEGVTREEYQGLVDAHKPVGVYTEVPKPATTDEIKMALGAKGEGKVGARGRVRKGDPVGLRLDIPAYTRHGVWVPTIHAARGGKVLAHAPVASVGDADFRMSEKAALKIAAGAAKFPFATIRGSWIPRSVGATKALAEQALADPAWIQVGMDPTRHGYFYDRATQEPVVAASEVIQVGPLVLAKDPVMGSRSDYRFSVAPAWDTPEWKAMVARMHPALKDGEMPREYWIGTTHRVTAFDPERFNPENDMGRGIYASSSREDVRANYAGEGPDLTNRIESRAEELADVMADEPEMFGFEPGYEVTPEEVEAEARRELHGGRTHSKRVYMALENPAILGGPGETRFELEFDEETGEESGSLVDFWEALRGEASFYDDVDMGELQESVFDGFDSVGLSDLISAVKKRGLQDAADYEADGALVSGEIVRAALEGMGFDGIVDNTVYSKFGAGRPFGRPMAGMSPDTQHVIAFRSNQVKSVWNRRPTSSPDMRYSVADVAAGREAEPGAVVDVKLPLSIDVDTPGVRFSVAGPRVGRIPKVKFADILKEEPFVYTSDRTRVGTYRGLDPDSGISIPLQGGPSYPFIRGNKRRAGWAFLGPQMQKDFQASVNEGSGVGVIMLYAPGNARANLTFHAAYMAEVRHNIKTGVLTEEVFLEVANDLRVKGLARTKKNKTTGKVGPWIGKDARYRPLWEKPWRSLEDYDLAMREATFDARSNLVYGWAPKKKTNRGAVIGADYLVGAGRKKGRGLPNIDQMIRLIEDPAYDGLERGHLVGAVRFRKGDAAMGSAEDIGVEEHMSYPLVTAGDGIGHFEEAIHILDIATTKRTPTNAIRAAELSRPTLSEGMRLSVAAFHGSPHDIQDGFSTSKIGTGEGAQAYGWGLYFADKQSVARHYKEALSGQATYDGQAPPRNATAQAYAEDFTDDLEMAAFWEGVYALSRQGGLGTLDDAIDYARKQVEWQKTRIDSYPGASPALRREAASLSEVFSRTLELLESGGIDPSKVAQGYGYTVRLAPADDEWLLWDRPLSEQSEKVKAAMMPGGAISAMLYPRLQPGRRQYERMSQADRDSIGTAGKARDDYNRLAEHLGSQRAASLALLDAGIRGIKYLDGTSRSKGEGSFNYVVFDDADVEITDRWSVAGEFPLVVGSVSDGRVVRDGVPNEGSISASLDEWREVPGLRDVPLAAFELTGRHYSAPGTRRIKQLAGEIERSGEIAPLIVVVDGEGPYILEGATRAEALYQLGATSFPAKVVVDESEDTRWSVAATDGDLDPRADGAIQYGELTRLELVRRRMQDYFYPVRKAQRAIGEVPESMDVDLAETTFSGRAGARLLEFEDAATKELNEILGDDLTLDDAHDFAYAAHAPERNEWIAKKFPDQGWGTEVKPGSGMRTSEAKRTVKEKLEGEHGDRYRRLNRFLRRMARQQIRTLDEAGLLTQDFKDAVTTQGYKYYVPLIHTMKGRPTIVQGRGFNVRGSGIKKAGGRVSAPDNVVLNLLAKNQEAIVRSEKAKVDRALYNLVTAHPDPTLWTVMDVPTRIEDDGAGVLKQLWDARIDKVEQTVFATIDGEVKAIVFAERGADLARAMNKTGVDGAHSLLRKSRKVLRYLAAINTSWNPEFVLTNFLRDAQTAGIVIAGEGKGGMMAVLKGAGPAIRDIYRHERGGQESSWWQRMKDAGGKTGWYHAKSLDEIQEDLAKTIKRLQREGPQRALNAGHAIAQFIDDANSAVENGVRLSAFKWAVQNGASDARAAEFAKNLTVNFNRQGEAQWLSSMYMFANASIQGSMRVATTLVKSKYGKRIAGGLVLGGFLADLLNYAMSPDDEDGENSWDAQPEYAKDRYFMLPKGDGTFVSIPMPYGFNFFQTLGRKMGELARYAAGEGGSKPTQAGADLLSSALGAFSPVGDFHSADWQSGLRFVSPTVLDPMVELATNRNWRNQPIRPEGSPFDRVDPPAHTVAWDSTNPIWKNAAGTLNWMTGGDEFEEGIVSVSPEDIQYLVEFGLGGVLRFGNRTLNTFHAMPKSPVQALSDAPFLRQLHRTESERKGWQVFRESAVEIEWAKNKYDVLRERGDREGAEEVRKELGHMLDLHRDLQRIDRRRRRMRTKIEAAEGAEKDELTDALYSEIRAFNRKVSDARQ